MPRGYRCIILAVFGWLIVTGANQPSEQTNTSQAEAQPAPPATPPPPETEYAPYPNLKSDACYAAKDHDAADLCAQWRAAFAAEKAAHEARRATMWGIIATMLSAAALLAILYSLRQTEKSLAHASKERVRATFRAIAGANETEQALKHARTNAAATARLVKAVIGNAEAQLRAYIDVEITYLPASGESDIADGICVKIQNHGHTPATDTRIVIAYELHSLKGDVIPLGEEPSVATFPAIPPLDHSAYRIILNTPEEVWDVLKVNLAVLVIDVELDYDTFGKRHTFKRAFQSNQDGRIFDFLPSGVSAIFPPPKQAS